MEGQGRMRKPKHLFLIWVLACLAMSMHAQSELACGGLGENVFTIGDFGSGSDNIGFLNPGMGFRFPRYQFASRFSIPPDDGALTLTHFTGDWDEPFPGWMPIGDNSPDPQGYMLAVNAHEEPGIFLEAPVTGLCENTTYQFSIDVINILEDWCCGGWPGKKIPLISVYLDSIQYLSRKQVHQLETWYTYTFTFTTPPGTTQMTLQIWNENTGGDGNDFAIDNIEIRPCGPRGFIDTERNNFFCTTDFDPVPMIAAIDSSYLVQWQVSTDNGGSWATIPGATEPTLLHTDFAAGTYLYRYLSARTPANLASPLCQFISDTVLIEVLPPTYTYFDTVCTSVPYFLGDQQLTQSGTYVAALDSELGCDSIVTIHLTIVPDDFRVRFATETPGCFGDTAGVIEVVPLSEVASPLTYHLNGIPFEGPRAEGLGAGNYLIEVEDQYG